MIIQDRVCQLQTLTIMIRYLIN